VTDLEIRPARPDEYDAAGQLTVDAYRAAGVLTDDDGYVPVLLDGARRATEAELLVAIDGSGSLVGTVTVAPAGNEWSEIAREGEIEMRMLAVAPSAWGAGIAGQLVDAVVDLARERGFERVVLMVVQINQPAHRLYERAGFRRVAERDWRPWPELLLMAYELPLTG